MSNPANVFMVTDKNNEVYLGRNNAIIKENCPLYGDLHDDAGVPCAVFAKDSCRAICSRCQEKTHIKPLTELAEIMNQQELTLANIE